MNQVSCPHCGMVLLNDGSMAGQTVTCPQCGRLFRMPAIQPTVAAPQTMAPSVGTLPPAQESPWSGPPALPTPGFAPTPAGHGTPQPGSAAPIDDEEPAGMSQTMTLALAGLVVVLAGLIAVIWFSMGTRGGDSPQRASVARTRPLSHWIHQLQNSPNPADRREAAESIVELGPDALATTLKTVITIPPDGRSYSVDKTAVEYLIAVGPALKGLLPQSLRAKDESVRVGAAYTFREMGRKAKGSRADLEKALGDPSLLVLRLVTAALGNLGEEAAPSVGKLIELLKHEDGHVRMAAAQALGQIGPDADPAIPVLTKLVESDKIRQVRQAAHQALNDLKFEEVEDDSEKKAP